MLDSCNTSIWNAMELPCTAVPLGFLPSSRGAALPMGLLVVAKRGNDHITIAVAEALEKGGLAKACNPYG